MTLVWTFGNIILVQQSLSGKHPLALCKGVQPIFTLLLQLHDRPIGKFGDLFQFAGRNPNRRFATVI